MTGFVVALDHPAIPGHFPGRPIVPGVLLLDAVFQAVAAKGAAVERLIRAKFPAPVAPGAAVDIQLDPRPDNRIAFTCRAGGVVVVQGEVRCRTATDPQP